MGSRRFWKKMPAPGRFDRQTRSWIPSCPRSGENEVPGSPQATDAAARLAMLSPTMPGKVVKIYGADGPWVWPLSGSEKFRDGIRGKLEKVKDEENRSFMSTGPQRAYESFLPENSLEDSSVLSTPGHHASFLSPRRPQTSSSSSHSGYHFQRRYSEPRVYKKLFGKRSATTEAMRMVEILDGEDRNDFVERRRRRSD
ncbi:hypothetical protein GUITHDRAFT_114678 [Guillardia theta CCMP2712]|uniref:Uncharacterized protein n=1 Tax=Guillardia theta (strain CCMP2712) TaxID=905079 RepID=L1ISN0_GUITC|nr:hypothetical protein GUITHDRAFT_114678 [Guillardia theta CCMP2712]EKX39243.1 hypothetical protein GUITHDRAFT_114678 [Guillardia theta CCMP2712]|eukprot:XP_005826223.1 hypothetical protein GUITHDRAFT_114678 [Guillardia theta CCMP2712]